MQKHAPYKKWQIVQIFCTQTITKVFRYIMACEGKILTSLYCTKYNEIHVCHSDVQKYISYTRSQKRFLIWDMPGNG